MKNFVRFITTFLVLQFLYSCAFATIRYVKPIPTGATPDGSSWVNASINLQTIINISLPGDEIWVAAGTYKPTPYSERDSAFHLKNGVTIYGGFVGTETVLAQRNFSVNASILSGDIGTVGNNIDNSYHVIANTELNNTAVLDGFRITLGNANGAAVSNFNKGAAVYFVNASPTLRNIVFANNNADIGAGIYNDNSSPILTNVIFTGNTANNGAGMYNTNTANPAIMNAIFANNSCYSNGNGGGIYNRNGSTPTIINTTFFSNSVTATGFGGGVYNDNSSPIITNTIFAGNTRGGTGSIVAADIADLNGANTTASYCFLQMPYSTNNYLSNILNSAGNIYAQDPLLINTNSPIGADNIWGTADDGLQINQNSLAVNAGNNTAIPSGILTDIAGRARVKSGIVDMGAYEQCRDTNITNFTICASQLPFNVLGHTVNSAGSDTLRIVNAFGCDSTAILNVVVNNIAIVTNPPVASSASMVVNLLAGSISGYADTTGANARFNFPLSAATNATGNIFVADRLNNVIRKITPAGLVSTYAGSGTGYVDSTAAYSKFNAPYSVATDAIGNVYVADHDNHTIRKITPAGLVRTLAGSTQGFADGTGILAKFNYPSGIATDAAGNVYVADYGNNKIRKITPSGVVSTLAGSTQGYADGVGNAAKFYAPVDVATDAASNVYVADYFNNKIRKITPAGLVTTLAGGDNGFSDGPANIAQFKTPYGVATDPTGNVYVADFGNNRIRKITPSGFVSTIAGSTQGDAVGLAATAKFYNPTDVAVDASGNIIVVDYVNNKIKKIVKTLDTVKVNCAALVMLTATGGTGYSWTGPQAITNGVPFLPSNSGTFTVSITGSNACENTKSVYVAVVPIQSITNFSICPTQLPFTYLGHTMNTFGNDTLHYTLPNGCDSAAILRLSSNGTTSISNQTICINQLPFIYLGHTMTIAGSDTLHYTNVAGCDSSAILNLIVRPSIINQAVTALQNPVCINTSAQINLANSQSTAYYYLVNTANNSIISEPIIGKNSAITIESFPLTVPTTIAVKADYVSQHAFKFNGTNNYLHAQTSVNADNGTWEAWISKANWKDFHDDMLFGNGINNTLPNAFYISLHPNLGLQFRYGGSVDVGNNYVSFPRSNFNIFAANSWHHLAATWATTGNKKYLKLFVDGALVASDSATATLSLGNVVYMGGTGLPDALYFGVGKMDEVRIYNYAKSSTQIQTTLSDCTLTSANGLLGNWNMETIQGSSPVTLDVSGFGSHAVLNNFDAASSYWVVGAINCNNNSACPIYNLSQTVSITLKPNSSSIANYTACANQLPLTYLGHTIYSAGLDTVRLTNAIGCDSFAILNVTIATAPSVGYTSSIAAATNASITVSLLAGSSQGYIDAVGAAAQFNNPSGAVTDAVGNIFVVDKNNHRIRKITPAGVVTTFAGSTAGYKDSTGTDAKFYSPYGIAIDAAGNLYVADQLNNLIRKITPSGLVTTLAGNGFYGFQDGAAADAKFAWPSGIATDLAGNIYVADMVNNKIRKISPAGVVSTLAGTTQGFADGDGNSAQFDSPRGVAVDVLGNIYVADANNNRIRKINAAGVVSTLAGSTAGYKDTVGIYAKFNNPRGIATDASGNVYVADYSNSRIRKITPSGEVSTLAGIGLGYTNGDTSIAQFNQPTGVTTNTTGTFFYVADFLNDKIRKITINIDTIKVNCGASLKLSGTGAVSYSWAGSQTITDNIAFVPSASGLFTVTGTANGCNNTKQVYIFIKPIQSITNKTICNTQLPYTFLGHTLTAAGSDTLHYTLASGCDSAAILNLKVGYKTMYVKTIASGLGNGSSWANATNDIQVAISNAGGCAPASVWVAAGTYYPANTIALRNGVSVYGGFNGTETLLSQRSWKTNITTINGINIGGKSVFTNTSISATALLDGFTITGGNASGMYNNYASPIIKNCIFWANVNAAGGGGMYNDNSNPSISNCIFWANNGSNGGGILNFSSSPSITNCVFASNTANFGGAVSNLFPSSNITISNCSFFGNRATANGYTTSGSMFNNQVDVFLKVANCTLWSNGDGEVLNSGLGTATITYSNVKNGYVGTGNINIYPPFADTINLKGADGIWATADDGLQLGPTSTLVDAGNPATVSPTTDITGFTRLGVFDIGAYEFSLLCAEVENRFYTSTIVGTAYQWQKDDGSGFANIVNDAVYSGATSAILKLTTPPSAITGTVYRCQVTTTFGIEYTINETIRFYNYWIGNADNNWGNPSNWRCGILPNQYTDVIIPGGRTFYPSSNVNGSIRKLQCDAATNILIQMGNNLIILGK